jgi:hypothetical protein
MATLDTPSSSDDLYDARDDEVSAYRPLFQGDVLSDVVLAEFGDELKTIMVLSHPCSIRQGPTLRDRITVAPVDARPTRISNKTWADSYFALMPLPGLFPTEDDSPFRYVDFNQVTSMRSEALRSGRRVACLSEYGVQLLQQRHVFHYTRVLVDLPTIHRALAPTFIEMELEQDWVEATVGAASCAADAIVRASTAFQDYLGPASSERRSLLKDPARRSIVVSETRKEIRKRFG